LPFQFRADSRGTASHCIGTHSRSRYVIAL
jgi:hypothetical protein